MILKKIESFVINLSVMKAVLLLLSLLYLLSMMLKSFADILNIDDIVFSNASRNNQNLIIVFFTHVLIGPLIETLLFQMLPFLLYERKPWLQKNKWFFVVVMGLIFGLGHSYSAYYMINTFIIGVVLMYAYILRSANNTSFATIALVHGSWNLIKFITLLF